VCKICLVLLLDLAWPIFERRYYEVRSLCSRRLDGSQSSAARVFELDDTP
jgi:hypothetical protein